ncbi:MAG: hypothetical protein KIT16_05530 [Rhodospirillaceae bacterium]|nr:hypothetical protein [Rhodospirillaceae bacterium]
MRWLAVLPTIVVAGWVALAPQALPVAAAATPLDRAAEQYVRLVLEIGTHEKGYIKTISIPKLGRPKPRPGRGRSRL